MAARIGKYASAELGGAGYVRVFSANPIVAVGKVVRCGCCIALRHGNSHMEAYTLNATSLRSWNFEVVQIWRGSKENNGGADVIRSGFLSVFQISNGDERNPPPPLDMPRFLCYLHCMIFRCFGEASRPKFLSNNDA